jgi:class 3 adenylate cyclase
MGSGGNTDAEYEAQIASLKAEIERLRRQASLTMLGAVRSAQKTGTGTIAGLDEMVLHVGADDTIGYLNPPMARLLGIADRKASLGTPLAQWDVGLLGDHVLSSLVQLARGSDETKTVERPCPGLGPEQLPPSSAGRPAGDPILSFVASSTQGRVQIIAQDVSKLRWLEATFARYVSPKVIGQLQGMGVDQLLTMERRELTVLFTDLRGFTSLVQQEAPEVVQETVNAFLTNMVECVERFDGTVQGFAGDEVMALFGAPLPQTDHALRGLLCAVEMQRAHQRWTASRAELGKPVRAAGVGLATGTVVVGNIGTPSLMTYTAQGHATNLAARLCAAAGPGEVLTIPETHSAALAALPQYRSEEPLPRLRFEPKGAMAFKNVAKPVQVLAVGTKDGGAR